MPTQKKCQRQNGVIVEIARIVTGDGGDAVQMVLHRVFVEEQLLGGGANAAVMPCVGIERNLVCVDHAIVQPTEHQSR